MLTGSVTVGLFGQVRVEDHRLGPVSREPPAGPS